MERFSGFSAGDELCLLLIEYTSSGVGVLFPLRYVHRELVCRSSGDECAIAFGTAGLAGLPDQREVRILFSRRHGTATLLGDALEGEVRIGRPEPGWFFPGLVDYGAMPNTLIQSQDNQ